MSNLLKVAIVPSDTASESHLPLVNALQSTDGEPDATAPSRRVFGDLIEAVDVDQADLLVYPTAVTTSSYDNACETVAQFGSKTPCLMFAMGDSTRSTERRNTIVYRDSILRSQRREHEFSLPAFVADTLEGQESDVLQPKAKPDHATIGFCGYVGTARGRFAYRLMGRHQKWLGLHLRNKAVNTLLDSANVRANCKAKTRFRGGSNGSAEQERRIRTEFLDNLFENDYALCLRGNGNFSYRFYEAMSAGRIPVFVDTDCLMPLEESIPYREIGVWLTVDQIPQIGDVLAKFHDALSDDQFNFLRLENRRIWKEKLSTISFHREMLKSLRKKLMDKTPTE